MCDFRVQCALILCAIKLSVQSNSVILLSDVNVASVEYHPKILNGTINGHPVLFGKNVTTNDDFVYASEGSPIDIELDGEYYVNHIQIRLWDYDSRDYYFTVEVSDDDKKWIRVTDRTTLPSRSWQYMDITPQIVKYIRIKGTNTANNYIHITKSKINC